MKKLFFYTAAIFAALSMTAAYADGLCNVTATATCSTVTVKEDVPKGLLGHTESQIRIDGDSNVYELDFDGEFGTITVASEGTEDVHGTADGKVTVGELVKEFHLTFTAVRDCAPATTPPPSKTPPPPTHHASTPPPPLAFTGLPGPGWPLVWALAIVGVTALAVSSIIRRRRAA